MPVGTGKLDISLGSSDHEMVICKPKVMHGSVVGNKRLHTTRVMGSNERAMFAHELKKISWSNSYQADTCATQSNIFYDTLMCLVNKHFPIKTVNRHTNDKPWINDTFRHMIRRRQRAYLNKDKDQYHLYRNKVNRLCKQLKRNFYKNRIEDLQHKKPGQWWTRIKQLTGDSGDTSTTPLEDLANIETNGSLQTLANQINTFFCSLCSNMPPLSSDSSWLNLEINNVPDHYKITPDVVLNQLSKLNSRKATGPDQLPTWILKDFAPLLCNPVAAVWNSSIAEGFLPDIWKCGYISPIPKTTPMTSVEKDIRPITLTSILSKELETHVVRWLWAYFEKKIDPRQFGSVTKSSTIHAMVDLLHQVYNSTDNPKNFARLLL